MKNRKQLSSPFSSGNGGAHFEAHVQASFLTLMLSGGYAPCLPCWPIIKIKPQGRIDGFNTDDLIVFIENPANNETRKLLGQIKHTIQITQKDQIFKEVIQAAWNDFNNPVVFNKNKDVFALITGPINKTDFDNVQWLLDLSRHTADEAEFFRYVNHAKFSPSKSNEKLDAFRYHLKSSNNNIEVSDSVLYSFFKHFYLLGYDFGKEEGVVLSLLQSHISQFDKENSKQIWGRIVDFIQTRNQIAGTITLKDIPEDIKNIFKQPSYEHIPQEFIIQKNEIVKTEWNQHKNATDLALINLIGGWSEDNQKDINVINSILNKDSIQWIPIVREIIQIPDSNISLFNGNWTIKDRRIFWMELGQRIFDSNLDQFKELAVMVLKEINPSFDNPPEVRYLYSFQNKTVRYSTVLRKGISEGLAMLGNQPKALTNCARNKPDTIVILAIREIFNNADWKLWGSLNNILPVLAEACPTEFLSAVENAFHFSPCPFDELFSQEGNGISGNNYMTGLLWALETLAWDEELLVRVCVILGMLASHDPGGNWANRPANSLTDILLPWMPHTIASIEKRKIAIETLYKEQPEIAWSLIMKLLPNQHQTTSGTHKPTWRNTIPSTWVKGVNNEEYWMQVSFYAEIAVSIASSDIDKLCVLINNLDNLPRPSFDKVLEILSEEKVTSLPEENRLPIWQSLVKLTTNHRKYQGAKWALDSELLSAIEAVSIGLVPKNPLNLYQLLFSDRGSDLYEEIGNWEEQSKKLNERRKDAIIEILKQLGISGVLTFVESVNSPDTVGNSLGLIASSEIDAELLPKYLNHENQKYSQFIAGYIWTHYYNDGWTWADELNKTAWTSDQLCQFLMIFPFKKETWDRVPGWLGKNESDYWLKINPIPFQADNYLEIAVDKFLFYDKPHHAISCLKALFHRKQDLDKNKLAKALLMVINLHPNIPNIDYYTTIELIKVLQDDPEFDQEQLFKIEWAYLQLLDHHHGASPILLERRLASDPVFFCEVIRLLYRSTKEDENDTSHADENKNIALNAWHLLHEWKTPPGMQKDGSFDESQFSEWLKRVKEICIESAHWEVAQINIGEVLIYCPPDQNNLWINKTVADALNSDDAKKMREGFRMGFFNSRGAHAVDPNGLPEIEFAKKYRHKAEDVEKEGFYRLAITLRELAENYDRDAERIIEESKREYV